MVADPMVMPIARDLLDCYAAEIAKVANPPTYVQLRTGSVVDHFLSTAQDECCEGLAWVRPAGFYPSSAGFPAQDEAGLPKGVAAWAVVLELGAVRCMPTPDASRIPTAGEWDAVTQAVMDDAAAMRRAICCYIADAPLGVNRNLNVIPGIWEPLSNEGGCAGGVLPVTIRAAACDCSQAGPLS